MRLVAVVLWCITSLAFAQTPPPKRPIAEVIAELSNKDPEVRSKAAWTLGHDYPDSPERLDPLEKAATSDPDATVRSNALGALDLKELGKTPRWTKVFLKILTTDANENVRGMALMRLSPVEPSNVEALIAAHEKETAFRVRNRIISALVDAKVPKLNDFLVRVVSTHPQPGRAINELARSGDPRAFATLKAAAKRGVDGVVAEIVYIKDPAVDDYMLELLDGSEDDQYVAITALVNSHRPSDPRLTPKLIKSWQGQSKADRKESVAKLKKFDNGDDDASIHNITRLLRAIAENDQAPCDARTAAKGELKTYLTKILPKTCGKN
jgi:HEAT repeat protein